MYRDWQSIRIRFIQSKTRTFLIKYGVGLLEINNLCDSSKQFGRLVIVLVISFHSLVV